MSGHFTWWTEMSGCCLNCLHEVSEFGGWTPVDRVKGLKVVQVWKAACPCSPATQKATQAEAKCLKLGHRCQNSPSVHIAHSCLYRTWVTFTIVLVHVTPSNLVQTLPRSWRRRAPMALDKVMELELPEVDYHVPCWSRTCRSVRRKMLEGRKESLPLSFLAFLSQPGLWLRRWIQKLCCFGQLSDDLPIPRPTHSPAHSCGCSLVTQPRWLCPDSSAPASSRWITQWFPLPTLVCQLHHLKNEEGTWAGVYVKDREQRNVLLSLTYTNISL